MSHISVFTIFWNLKFFQYKWGIELWVRKRIHYSCEDGIEKSVPLEHSASLMMPIDDPWNRLFYPTLMIDSYNHTSFQHLTNFLNRWKNKTIPKYQAKYNVVVIFSQLLSLNLNYCLITSNIFENVQVYLLSQAVTRYCMIYFGDSSKIESLFKNKLYIKDFDVENL